MNKRILLILIPVGVIIILGIWFFFFRTSAPTVPTTTSTTSPFGYGGPDVLPAGQPTKAPSSGLDASGRPVAKLFQISDTPISGAVGIIKNGSTIIRYTERATGHIIDVNPETMERVKISNKTLPKIYEAYYKKDGSGVIYRSLDNNDSIMNTSISLTAPKSTSTGEVLHTLNASMLRGDIGEIAVLPSGNLIYSTNNPGAIITSEFMGDKSTNIYTTPFTEWRISPSGLTEVYITTKAGSEALGYSYKLDIKTGFLTKVLGPLNSLLVLPNPNKPVVAYTYNKGASFVFESLNTSTKKTSVLTPPSLVEKCVWSNKLTDLLYCGVSNQISSTEPDSWYMGLSHFSDRIWAYNTNTTFTDVLAEPKKDLGVDIDVYNPTLTPDEDYLVFMNKTDLSLWALKLK